AAKTSARGPRCDSVCSAPRSRRPFLYSSRSTTGFHQIVVWRHGRAPVPSACSATGPSSSPRSRSSWQKLPMPTRPTSDRSWTAPRFAAARSRCCAGSDSSSLTTLLA
ncbi:unnamed protein product, partial [Symbiodinium necroappetens]